MSESKLNQHFKKILENDVVMNRVEPSLINIGFPDWYISLEKSNITVEAKYIREWPKRSKTKIRFKRFTNEQKVFTYTHGRKRNGGAFILLQIENDIMIFKWNMVYKLEAMDKSQCLKNCIFKWGRSDKSRKYRTTSFKNELIEILSVN